MHEFAPLYVYTTISSVNKANQHGELEYHLRYRGIPVAALKYNDSKEYFELTEKELGLEKFNFPDKSNLAGVPWKGKNATRIREYFKNYTISDDTWEKEARLESALITELRKSDRKAKLISKIQPITLMDSRFQMRTAFAASELKNVFSETEREIASVFEYERGKGKGGGIDLMCRVGTGRRTNLAIFELKDENNSNEPPHAALSQALAYAVFIRILLRSDAANGTAWWEHLFGFTPPIPKKLTIDVVAAMPLKKGESSDSDSKPFFANKSIKMSQVFGDDEYGDDEFKMHYMFFDIDKSNNDRVTYIKTSLDVK